MQQIGRYQILEELGRGAMGVVYRALDPAIGRPVAIKTIRLRDITDDAERERLRERLFREAQSAGLVSHPGIVTIYDVGEQHDVTYIAMEFVDGPTLEKLMCGDQPVAPERIIEILKQTAAALDFAHKKGIVHRDIKPANIMVGEEGAAKITDFGVAKLARSQQMTHAGMVVGTPNYMAPEQIEGRPVDGRTDQFALAVVAYELLTGEKPFAGEHLTAVLYKIVSEEPAPPHSVNATLPWAASMVLGRALAKDPAKRYPTATEFINALDAALKSKKAWKPLTRGASQTLPTAIAPATPIAARPRLIEPDLVREPEKGGWFWKTVGTAFAGIAVVAVLFLAAQRWLMPADEPADVVPETRATEAAKPAPMPPPEVSAPAAQAGEQKGETMPVQPPGESAPAAEAPAAAQQPPSENAVAEGGSAPVREPAAAKPRIRAEEKAPPGDAAYALQVVTNPPGATIIADRNSEQACSAPCELRLPPGRHVVAATMDGYRRELRIVDLNRPVELFMSMSRPTGTVRIESKPPGAQILINNEAKMETTPASFVLPAGKYRITVVKDGRRADQDIEIRDGALVRYELDLNP